MDQPWTPRPKPEQAERLERRVEFGDYASTRDFLERLNALCETEQRFPDISFGRTYAPIEAADWAFTAAIDALVC
jgi:4a-hydroxytetrahydrobiopterin dehydratase